MKTTRHVAIVTLIVLGFAGLSLLAPRPSENRNSYHVRQVDENGEVWEWRTVPGTLRLYPLGSQALNGLENVRIDLFDKRLDFVDQKTKKEVHLYGGHVQFTKMPAPQALLEQQP